MGLGPRIDIRQSQSLVLTPLALLAFRAARHRLGIDRSHRLVPRRVMPLVLLLLRPLKVA